MPPEDPVTGRRQVALEIDRFPAVAEADTGIDPRVRGCWPARLLEIAAQLQGSAPP